MLNLSVATSGELDVELGRYKPPGRLTISSESPELIHDPRLVDSTADLRTLIDSWITILGTPPDCGMFLNLSEFNTIGLCYRLDIDIFIDNIMLTHGIEAWSIQHYDKHIHIRWFKDTPPNQFFLEAPPSKTTHVWKTGPMSCCSSRSR